MSSTQDLTHQVILFVGRPTDSRKGLSLLFESLTILSELSAIPSFHVWIVGGSPREMSVISDIINLTAAIRALRASGRMMVWGRVENSALSELYSRALVTVIPSYREEFGIVAVEAMMCGCPVVAARTGGLTDIVMDGKTGALFEQDDAVTLAAVLCAYLRNPELREIQSQLARAHAVNHFSRSSAYMRLSCLYLVGASEKEGSGRSIPVQSLQCSALHESRVARLKAALKINALSILQVSETHHPVFRIESTDGTWCAKFFVKRASQQASLFGHVPNLCASRGGSISFFRVVYNGDNPASAVLRYFDEHAEPLVIFDWAESTQDSAVVTDEVVHTIIRRCQTYKPLEGTEALASYMRALDAFASRRDNSSLESFDSASAELNGCMTGGRLLLCRSHPQIELVRLRNFLVNRAWPISDHFRVRALQLIDILTGKEFIIQKPTLAHGDLKRDHFLIDSTGEMRLADFEHSRYAVGPLDLAIWLCESAWERPWNAQEIWNRVISVVPEPSERLLCICWIVAETLFRALLGFSKGQCTALATANRMLRGFGLLLANAEFTQ
jgi:glycosyl transferase family 1